MILANLHAYKPVELCQVLLAYTEEGALDDTLLESFEAHYKVRHEEMKPIDSATFYYCFTKAGFKGDGLFYKYL